MKLSFCSLLWFGLSLTALSAADKPLLAIPGKVIYESALNAAPGAPWKIAKGAWELKDGVWRGAEKPEDKHGAVARLPDKLTNFVIEYEFKFEGARSTSLSINAVKDHMARIMITPTSVTVQRDDNDHEGPDKSVVFGRFTADFQPGTWHKVRLEMVGDTLLGQVDDKIAFGSNDLFKTEKAAPGFTVGGQSVDFRNLKISEATANPEWESVKASLPKFSAEGGPAKAAAKKKAE